MADEHSTGVYLTKAEAEAELTRLRDAALIFAEHAGPADRDIGMGQATAYRIAMGIVHNVNLHCPSCDMHSCDEDGNDIYHPEGVIPNE